MAGKSNALEADMLKAVTYQATTVLVTTPPGTGPFLALFTGAPTDAGGGTEVTAAGAYARVDTKSKWGTPTGASPSQVQNNAVISFVQASANWPGPITHFGLYTAVTAGTLLMWGALTVSKTVLSGDTASFATSQLTLTED